MRFFVRNEFNKQQIPYEANNSTIPLYTYQKVDATLALSTCVQL
jgi:hypothetical protein